MVPQRFFYRGVNSVPVTPDSHYCLDMNLDGRLAYIKFASNFLVAHCLAYAVKDLLLALTKIFHLLLAKARRSLRLRGLLSGT